MVIRPRQGPCKAPNAKGRYLSRRNQLQHFLGPLEVLRYAGLCQPRDACDLIHIHESWEFMYISQIKAIKVFVCLNLIHDDFTN